MATPIPPTPKSRYLPVIVGLVGIAVVIILGALACLLFVRRVPFERGTSPTAIAPRPTIRLPTASSPTTTPGPPAPYKLIFAAEEPIKGFSDCDSYGFRGVVTAGNGSRLQNVQIVIWGDQAELLGLSSTDAEGSYLIEIAEKPAQRKLWVQVFENDLPVSQPVLVETQTDCQNGFQVYQIDWRKVGEQ